MSIEPGRLDACWRARTSAAAALATTEQDLRHVIRAASATELVALIEMFSPARSTGPEWTRTFEPLVEHLWAWLDDATLAELADVFGKRGLSWLAVANALSAEHGAQVRQSLRQPAWARIPAFVTV